METACVLVFADPAALMRGAAERVVDAAARACSARRRFLFCLSGGNTPRALYELLATPAFAARIDWSRTELCFGDERCVPPDAPESNYGMVAQALLRHVPLDPARIHRIAGEQEPVRAAAAYEATLATLLGRSASSDTPTHGFDLVLLGLGADGHTASLLPGSNDEPGRWVSARGAHPLARVTLTPQLLNNAEATLFLVSGAQKAERLAQVLYGPHDPLQLPAQRIVPTGELTWLVDAAAATRLDPRTFHVERGT